MADETYRPQKKSVEASEISGAEAQEKLEQMAQEDASPSPAPSPQRPQFPNPEGSGIQMMGTPPPQFQRALAQNRGEDPQAQTQRRGPTARPTQDRNADAHLRTTGSGRLEELLQEIAHSTAIYEPVELPSKGKFYDGEDGPTDGVIHLRPMTGEEEQVLATPRFVKNGKAINMIFNRCMQEKFDSTNFLSQDRTYMLIYLRIISYSQDYDVEVRCPETDKQFAAVIDLNSLFVDYCPPEFNEENLTDKLPTTGFKFSYRLARGADEQRVNDYRDRRIKGFETAGQPDDTLLYRTALLIEEIESISDKHEIQELLKKLPISDVSYLRTIVNEPPFGMDTKVSITSPFTMSEFEVELPLEANFFFPKARREKTSTQ